MKRLGKVVIVAILACAIGITVLFKVIVLDNPDLLCMIGQGFDEPSRLYYASVERIYKISDKKKVGKKFKERLTEGGNEHLYNCYIRILGVIGEGDAIPCLMQVYAKHQNNKNLRSIIHDIIISIGLIGNEASVHFLENLLKNYNANIAYVPSSLIVHSLYLITGKKYFFTNNSGEKDEIYLSKERIEARKIIKTSRGRKRSLEEMIALDKMAYRPAEYQ